MSGNKEVNSPETCDFRKGNVRHSSLALEARRMAPWGMRSSLPFPEGFLLLVVRYSLVPGGKLARFAKLLAGSCSVAMTKGGEKREFITFSFKCYLK